MRYSAIKSTYTESPETADHDQTQKSKSAAVTVPDLKARIINLNGKYNKKIPGKLNQSNSKFNSPCFPNTASAVKPASRKKRPHSDLNDTESLYKNLFNNSPFAIGILDKETMQLLEVNETATKLYGYSTKEFLQLTAYDIRIPEQHELLTQQIKTGNYTIDKTIRSHKKKNGDIIQIEPTITQITYKGKQAYLMTIHDITEKLLMQEELGNTKITRQKEITRAALEAQEKSRAEIGRELHDNINQLLGASILFIKKAQTVSENDRSLIEMGTDIISTAITEIRKLSSSLVVPSLNKLGLKESIGYLLPILTVNDTSVEFDLRINEELIEKELKINLYRIIQEQFSNIIKHAAATKVKVTMVQSGNLLTLEIRDNGKGFDQQQKAEGIGLDNIIQRADSYNGKVTIESSPGNGCKLNAAFLLS